MSSQERETLSTAAHGMSGSAQRRDGLLGALRRALVGERVERLREREQGVSFGSLVLMIVQSAALVLVFGHAEIMYLMSRQITLVAIASVVLFALVASAICADMTVVRTIRRMPILARNRASALLVEHVAYVAFVLLVEMSTLGVVFAALESNPDALTSSAPLLPMSGALFIVEIVLRAGVIAYTAIQMLIVSQSLPSTWHTAIAPATEIVGGYAQRLLRDVQLANTDLASVFAAYASMTQPAPRRRTWWNGWLVARDEQQHAAEDARRQATIASLRELTRDREREYADALAREQTEREQIAAALEHERAALEHERAARERAFAEQFGALRDEITTLREQIEQPRSSSARARSARVLSTRDRVADFLASLDIAPAKTPSGKRGVWLASTDVARLIETPMRPEMLRRIVAEVGDQMRDGTSYVAEFRALMRELAQRNILTADALAFWRSLDESSEPHDGTHDGAQEAQMPTPISIARRA